MNITPDFVSNYSCGRAGSAIFVNLNRECLFRNCRKLPDTLSMASQSPTAPGAWYPAQHNAGFAAPHGEGSCHPPSYSLAWCLCTSTPQHSNVVPHFLFLSLLILPSTRAFQAADTSCNELTSTPIHCHPVLLRESKYRNQEWSWVQKEETGWGEVF